MIDFTESGWNHYFYKERWWRMKIHKKSCFILAFIAGVSLIAPAFADEAEKPGLFFKFNDSKAVLQPNPVNNSSVFTEEQELDRSFNTIGGIKYRVDTEMNVAAPKGLSGRWLGDLKLTLTFKSHLVRTAQDGNDMVLPGSEITETKDIRITSKPDGSGFVAIFDNGGTSDLSLPYTPKTGGYKQQISIELDRIVWLSEGASSIYNGKADKGFRFGSINMRVTVRDTLVSSLELPPESTPCLTIEGSKQLFTIYVRQKGETDDLTAKDAYPLFRAFPYRGDNAIFSFSKDVYVNPEINTEMKDGRIYETDSSKNPPLKRLLPPVMIKK